MPQTGVLRKNPFKFRGNKFLNPGNKGIKVIFLLEENHDKRRNNFSASKRC
jgi:hypothetical protein